MKNIIRIMGLCALVAIAFSSCKKNETRTFKAKSVELESDSKTHLNLANWMVWDRGDMITVFDRNGESQSFVVTSPQDSTVELGSEAEFHIYEGQVDFMDKLTSDPGYYKAFYPDAFRDADYVRVSIPAQQVLPMNGVFSKNTLPMFGTNGVDGNFAFDTYAGILTFTMVRSAVGTDEQFSYDSLTIEATGDMAGYMSYRYDGDTTHYFTSTSQVISIVSKDANNAFLPIVIPSGASSSQTISVVLPDGALNDGFTLRGYYHGNEVFNVPSGTNTCEISAKKIRYMTTLSLPPHAK